MVFEFFKRVIPEIYSNLSIKNRSHLPNPSDKSREGKKSLSKLKYHAASCLSPGRERSHNEDTLFISSLYLDGIDSALFFGLYLVADGMGGHQSGEVASNLAAQGVSQYLIEKIIDPHFYSQKSISPDHLNELVVNAVNEAQDRILQHVPGGGTTLTMVVVINDLLISAHVGDSRLYLLNPDDGMTLHTKDHTLVKRLVDLGEITKTEAINHPQRNILYRALGQEDPFKPDISQISLDVGEGFLICSDGLWGVLEDSRISEIIGNGKSLDETACDLVQAANEAGGPDNISVILVERLD